MIWGSEPDSSLYRCPSTMAHILQLNVFKDNDVLLCQQKGHWALLWPSIYHINLQHINAAFLYVPS